MRFVFIPSEDAPYDWRMVRGLAQAIEVFGHDVRLVPPIEYTRDNLSWGDVVFDLNRARPGWLPENIIHIVWVQDFRPGTIPLYGERKRGNDLTYVLADPDALGLSRPKVDGVLLTGINPKRLAEPQKYKPIIDISMCGYIPEPLEEAVYPGYRWPGQDSFGVYCHKEMEKMYVPLTGHLKGNDFFAPLATAFREKLSQAYGPEVVQEEWEKVVRSLGYWIIDQPRRLDRIKLAQMSLEVTKNCRFMGNNWKRYSEFSKFAVSHTKNENILLRTYAESKINLHTNSHGFGIHSRVLEAMSVGGFIMTHSVVDPTRTGRMCEYFEPDRHFGEFTPDNFTERARFWLENDAARGQATAEAKKIIAGKHLWKHRAAQILGDLGLKGVLS